MLLGERPAPAGAFTKGSSKAMIDSMTSTTRRIGRLDIAIAVAMSLLGLFLMYGNVTDDKVNASVAAIPVFLLVTAPLLWRSVAPVGALGAALAALVVHDLIFGGDVIRCGVVLPETFLLVFSAGVRLGRRVAGIGLALGLGAILAESITFLGGFGVVMAGATVAVWATGRVARSRADMAEELQVRTGELREARDERARLEVATDRARLSAELDELLQRRLGELVRLADAENRPSDPAAATATLAAIETESRSTLEEMRAVVGVLRHDESDVAIAPQPTLTNLEALLIRAKGAGARLTVDGSPRVLPPGVELSAYRVVEHLLSALDDSPDVEVHVGFGNDALELAVSGPARRLRQVAVERARQRVELQHGTLRATTRSGRAEAVVSLPLLAGT
jgi:signal transduction histidine kinase